MAKKVPSPADADAAWMRLALREAEASARRGEVPVGAVAVRHGKKLAAAHNRSISACDPSAHAEVLALRLAARKLRNYRLNDIILYVTKEPCAMCAGALVWARVERVVYGCPDPKAGALGSAIDLPRSVACNHRFQVRGGVLDKECRYLLQSFFQKRRSSGGEQGSTGMFIRQSRRSELVEGSVINRPKTTRQRRAGTRRLIKR